MAMSDCDFIAVARVTHELNPCRKNQYSPYFVKCQTLLAGFTGENRLERARAWAKGEPREGGEIRLLGYRPGKGKSARALLGIPWNCPGGAGFPSINPDQYRRLSHGRIEFVG